MIYEIFIIAIIAVAGIIFLYLFLSYRIRRREIEKKPRRSLRKPRKK